jgi:hypothetical protein
MLRVMGKRLLVPRILAELDLFLDQVARVVYGQSKVDRQLCLTLVRGRCATLPTRTAQPNWTERFEFAIQ